MRVSDLFSELRWPDWQVEGADWPHRDHSRFVQASAIRWHVQVLGEGPTVLLLHGTGAATHSFRGLAPRLAERFQVVMVDLPGHGFTTMPSPSRLTLSGMAVAVAELLEAQGWTPALLVGHSAGAAIGCRLVLDGRVAPALLVSINGALRPFPGVMGRTYQWVAKLTASNPMAANWVADSATNAVMIPDLMRQVGSRLDAEGLEYYRRLVRCSGHASAALTMMASWDLSRLEAELANLSCPLLLVAGARDAAVPPAHAHHLAASISGVSARVMPDLGHLSHEEAPAATAEVIVDAFRSAAQT